MLNTRSVDLRAIETPAVNLFEKRNVLFAYWPCCLGFGIALYFTLPFEPSPVLLIGLFVAALFCFFVLRRFIHKNPLAYFISHGLIALLLGFAVISARGHYLHTTFIQEPLKNVTITGIVLNVEQTNDQQKRIILSVVDDRGDVKGTNDKKDFSQKVLLQKVQLKGRGDLLLEPGWHVQCTVTLLPLSRAVSPVAYNFKRTHYYAGISASGRIKSCSVLDRSNTHMNNLRFRVTNLLREKLVFPYGEIAAALVTGDRSGISKDLRQQFNDAGLAHVLAISGLHLGLVAGIIFLTLKHLLLIGYAFKPVIPIREISAAVTIGVMAFYLGISGFGFPAVRSFLMTTLIMLGLMFNRNPFSMRSIALAASAILLTCPESIVSASFQLSFAAVIALIATYEVTAEPLKNWVNHDPSQLWWRRPMIYFTAIILTTTVATLATTPLSMALFNRLTLQAVLGNLMAIPLIGFWIMPTLVVATISLTWGGWDLAFLLLEWGLKTLSVIARYVSMLPGSGLVVPSPSDWFYPFFVIGGLLLCIGPWLRLRMLGLVLMLFSFVFFKQAHLPIGYFSADRSVFALYQAPILYVSSLSRGRFYTDQWRQHLGVPESNIRLIPTQEWQWHADDRQANGSQASDRQADDLTYAIIVDPFKNIIDKNLEKSYVKKRFLKTIKRKKRSQPVLTNAYLKLGPINGNLLLEKGSAFVYQNGTIRFDDSFVKNRPWD